jgi:CubicO group peptidase (beta-lactamase class C family)
MASDATQPFPTALEHTVRDEMARWDIPGMAVGVWHDGEISTAAFGIAHIETGCPVLPESLFRIASISKVFTATLVMTLVDEGHLDLDAPLRNVLPDLALADEQARDTLTMRHLLTHTGGFFGDDEADYGMGDDALGKAVANFSTLRQLTAPGELWSYSNAGFDLAGHVAATLLDQPYETAMHERVIEPLGLERTFFWAHEAIAYPAAIGHLPVKFGQPERKVDREFGVPRRTNPCGGLISNVADMLTFARFHLGDGTSGEHRVLSAATLRSMQEPQVPAANFVDDWALGWDHSTVGGERVIGHGGSAAGFQTRLSLVPERNFAIAIAANDRMGLTVNSRIERWALEHLLDLARPEPQPVTLDAEALQRFAGEYSYAGVRAEVVPSGGGLRLEFMPPAEAPDLDIGIPPVEMAPISDREFIATEGLFAGIRTDFILHEDGSVRFMRFGGRIAERV